MMVEKLRLRQRLKEDWLPLALASGALGCVAAAIMWVNWAPETAVIGYTISLGLLIGWLLAKGDASWRQVGLIHLAYGLTLTPLYLARLWPGATLLTRGWLAHSREMGQNWALFVDRVGGWLTAVSSGGTSQETIVFAFGLGLLGWLLAAYATWTTFRQRRPLNGLTLAGVLLAVNSYYGGVPLWPLLAFIGFSGLLATAVHFDQFEREWRARGSDYSDQLRLDLLLHGALAVMVVVAVAAFVPSLNYRAAAQFARQQPAIQQIEERWERLFGGVRPPTSPPQPAGQPTGSLPRSFLLGDPPELRETVVMTAVVASPAPPDADLRHWRGVSYDIYDGRGWAISAERRQAVPAGQRLTLLPAAQTTEIGQRINWLTDERVLRYVLGEPLQFDHETVTLWRGAADLTRAQGYESDYEALSRASTATAAELRLADMTAVPPALMARYTQLPADLPARVGDLARQIAGDAPTAYDQARALERFLRQYEYSLEVDLPPRRADPVDFFLFEMQRGYCDYYASALAVMARSLGLPARLVTGYLAQPPNRQGAQTIYANQAHSWTEIYLGEYGWIAFEPTAAFDAGQMTADIALAPAEAGITPPPIPEADPARRPAGVWLMIGLLLALSLTLWLISYRWRQAEAGLDGAQLAYYRLQRIARRLGQPTPPQQTPNEFAAALLAHLAATERPPRRWLPEETAVELAEPIWELTNLFVAQQYSGKRLADERRAGMVWRRLRRPLWWRKSRFYQ
jgi:transglutaminase-like putative cysteine protease